MQDQTFDPFGGSGLGAVPKGWIPVADVYRRIAVDFFEQLGNYEIDAAPYVRIAGKPSTRHDAHSTPCCLTWRVLSFCRRVAFLEKDGSATEKQDLGIVEPRDPWSIHNRHLFLPHGKIGTGADENNRPLSEDKIDELGYRGHQLVLVRVEDVNRGRTQVLNELRCRGRPNKGLEAAAAYRARFPHGHEAEGVTTDQVAAEISRRIGKNVVWKTITRGIKSND